MASNQKLILFIIAAVVILIGAGLFFSSPIKKYLNHRYGDEPLAEKINTADWKTYRNEKYGYEIKYPGEYEQSWNNFLESTDQIRFAPKTALSTASLAVTTTVPAEEADAILSAAGEVVSDREIMIAGKKAREVIVRSSTGKNLKHVIVANEVLTYHFEGYDLPIENLILSGLKLDDPFVDTGKWMTYRNAQLGFEVSHPASWTVDEIFASQFKDVRFVVSLWDGSEITVNLHEGYQAMLERALDDARRGVGLKVRKFFTNSGVEGIRIYDSYIHIPNGEGNFFTIGYGTLGETGPDPLLEAFAKSFKLLK